MRRHGVTNKKEKTKIIESDFKWLCDTVTYSSHIVKVKTWHWGFWLTVREWSGQDTQFLRCSKNKSKNNIQSIHTKCEIDKVLRKCSKASAIRCYWAHQDCWEPWPPTPGAGIWTQRKSIRNSWRKFEVDFRQGYTRIYSLSCWEIYLSATVKRSMVVRKLCCSIDYL